MKITKRQEQTLKQLFAEMGSKQDFLALLNTSKQFIYKDKTVPFSEKQLNYFLIKNSDKFKSKGSGYTSFVIKKKSGEDRTIHAPIKGLKEFQKALNLILQSVHEPNTNATGFIPHTSIVKNANPHVGKHYVYNIDLKDFFPSIDGSRVWGRLLVAPFDLGTSAKRRSLANMIKTLCCTELEVSRYENDEWVSKKALVLPQGAPTSPVLTNAICDTLDRRLTGVARRFGLQYTRYADDITFSSNHNSFEMKPGSNEQIFKKDSTFDKELKKIVSSQNFFIKETKTRLQKRGYRQKVTGLVVNDKINVPSKYVKTLRQWIYFWEHYGYEKSYSLFLKSYLSDRGHVKNGKPNMIMVIEGKLLYLKMVKGEEDSTYLKLRERFDALNLAEPKKVVNVKSLKKLRVSQILDTIFEKGLDTAMENYKK